MRVVVLDLETTFSFKPRHKDGKLASDFGSPFNSDNRVVLVGAYDYLTEKYISYDVAKPSSLNKLKQLVRDTDVLVGHNIKYDALWLRAIGCDLAHLKYRDTMLREYLMWQGKHPSLSLTNTAPRYGGTPKMDLIGAYFDRGVNTDDIPRFILAQYLYEDVMNTKMVYEGQMKDKRLTEQRAYDNFYHDVLEAVIEMEWNGAKFNKDVSKEVETAIEEQLFSSMAKVVELASKYADKATFNPDSPAQLARIMFGLEIKKEQKERWEGFTRRFKPWDKGSQSKLEWEVENCFNHLENSLSIKPDVAWITSRDFLTITGISTGSKVIDSMLQSGKLTKKQEEFVAAVQSYSKASTWKSSNLAGVYDGIRDDGYVHGHINMHVTSTRRFSSSSPNCFPYDVEVLTEKGFMTFDKWDGEKVAQVDYNNGMLMTFADPINVIKKDSDYVIELGTRDWGVSCTPDHDMLCQDRKTGKFKKVKAVATPNDLKIHNSYCYTGGGDNWSESKVVLFAAFQADGHLRKQDGIVEFKFSKERKITRLRDALEAEGIPFRVGFKPVSKGKDQTKISISRKDVPEYFTKNLTSVDLYGLGLRTRTRLASELLIWDGDATRLSEYYCKEHSNATWAQELFSSIGWRANIRHYDNKRGGSCFAVCLSKKGYSLTTNRIISHSNRHAPVWCFTMPKGTLVVRYKGKMTVTGNCQNWPREGTNPIKKLIQSRYEGGEICCSDYGQLEFRIAGLLSQDTQLIKDVNDGIDIHSHTATVAFGDKFTNSDGKERKEMRQKAKTKTFEFQYGATPKTKTDQAIFDAFYGKYFKLQGWQERVMHSVANTQAYICPYTFAKFDFAGANHGNEYEWGTKAKNYPIQFLSDCINKAAIVGMYQRIKGRADIKLILTVHDSNVLDAAPQVVNEAKQILREEMSNVTHTFEKYFGKSLDIPLAVDVSSGGTWFDQESDN
jgi:DNA polymerase I-like protein with 3'-5' exonuclease and polymerase domains